MEGLEKYRGMVDDAIPDDLAAYAKTLYPNISEDTIRQNRIELDYAMKFNTKCNQCFGVEHCPGKTKGLMPVAEEMRPDGWIEWDFVTCKYSAGWRYVRR